MRRRALPLSDVVRRRRRTPRPDLDRTVRRYFVYWLYDGSGQCLYIGRSCNVPARIRVHLADTDWATNIRSVQMTGPYTWDEAVAAEWKAIKRENPPHNIEGTPRRRARLIV